MKVVTETMRRTSGIRVGTIVTLAVLLVALSVGAGAYAFHPSGSVRTAALAHSDVSRTLAALPTTHHAAAVPSVKIVSSHPSGAAVRPNAGPASNLTGVTIAPGISNLNGGASVVLTATLVCQGNITCDANVTATTTYNWTVANPLAGSLNVTNTSSVKFTALWAVASTDITLVATNNTTAVNSTAVVNVASTGAPAISITYTVAWKVYEILPLTVTFNISVANGSIGPATTNVTLNVRDLTGGCATFFNLIGLPPCPTVINDSLKVTSGQTSYSMTVNYSVLNAAHYADATKGLFPADEYQFITWVNENNSIANVTAGFEANTFLVFQTPSGVFASPVPGSSISTGNVTFVVTYGGDFITAAQLVVENATKQVVYLQAVFAVGQGSRTVGAPTPWLAATPGVYTAIVNVTTPYGSFLITQAYTVVPAGQTIYVNHTAYHNVSLLGGLSPGIAGMLLLVVGLIVGLVVALVLGRMMWGQPAQPAAPQPWSPSSSSSSTSTTTTPSTGSSDMGSEGGGSTPPK
jgi:hypothetical protein